MQDMTGLDLKQPKFRKGKILYFLEKFRDLEPVDEIDTWKASKYSVPENLSLRTRN